VAGLFYEDVLNGLAAAGVPFVVVGGVAVNLQVPVASIDALIRMKEGSGRAQDASDVEALRRVKEVLRGS